MNPEPGDLPSVSKQFAFRGEGGSAFARGLDSSFGIQFRNSQFPFRGRQLYAGGNCLCRGLVSLSSSLSLSD